MAIDTYDKLVANARRKPRPAVLWRDVPDYLRLDPARAMRIYKYADWDPIRRAEVAAENYMKQEGVCIYASNELMRCWGHEFFEKCRLKLKSGYRNVCSRHYNSAPISHAHLFVLESSVVRGITDPDVVEREWALVMDRAAQLDPANVRW